MKLAPDGHLALTVCALGEAEDALEGLPVTSASVRRLHERFNALRTVCFAMLRGGGPTLTEAQKAKLFADATSLVDDVLAERPQRVG